MSKQNVHQNVIRKCMGKIVAYVKQNMPEAYEAYFPAALKEDREYAEEQEDQQ